MFLSLLLSSVTPFANANHFLSCDFAPLFFWIFDVYIIYLYRLFTRLSVLSCCNLFYLCIFFFFFFRFFSVYFYNYHYLLFLPVRFSFCRRRRRLLLLFASRNSLNGWHWTYKCRYIFPSAMKYCLLCICVQCVHSNGHCFHHIFLRFCRSFAVPLDFSSLFFAGTKINLDCQSYNSDAWPLMCDFFLLFVFFNGCFQSFSACLCYYIVAVVSKCSLRVSVCVCAYFWVSLTVILIAIFHLFAVT